MSDSGLRMWVGPGIAWNWQTDTARAVVLWAIAKDEVIARKRMQRALGRTLRLEDGWSGRRVGEPERVRPVVALMATHYPAAAGADCELNGAIPRGERPGRSG